MLSNLNSSVSNLRSQLESLSTSRDLPADWSGKLSASAMGAQVINKQRGELQIHTQEGDVVTLKFSSKVGISIEGQQTSDGNTTLTSGSLDVHSRSKIAVSVEGDLNDEEMAAINDLVDKVSDLTNEFFNGDMESVLAQAMNLSYDNSVLADYSLDLSLKQSVRTYAYAVQWSPPMSSAAPSVPVATADEPVTPEAASADDVVVAPVATHAETVTAPVSTAEKTVGESAANSDSTATQIVADFVARVRSVFHMSATDSTLGMSYEFKAKLLISSISNSAPAETTPAAETLNYLYEQLGLNSAT